MNRPILSLCIVLYNSSFSESKAISSLLNVRDEIKNITVDIYLNGNCDQDLSEVNELFSVHDNHGANLFLLDNYGHCAKQSKDKNIEWIAFFDQDTEITPAYIKVLKMEINANKQHFAFFPKLIVNEKPISPMRLTFGSSFPLRTMNAGEYKNLDFVGLNSGSVYKIIFLENLQSIEKDFRLDALDNCLSYKLYKSGLPFKVLDVEIQHNLSVMQGEPLNEVRARSILSAEFHYFKLYRNAFEFVIYKVRLLFRLLKSFFKKNYLYKKSILIEYFFK